MKSIYIYISLLQLRKRPEEHTEAQRAEVTSLKEQCEAGSDLNAGRMTCTLKLRNAAPREAPNRNCDTS
uniref:Uncharacterized protein n=1 Tax=Setaria digitata TaxID=48799 RepID=A0A915PPJ3_9BILA